MAGAVWAESSSSIKLDEPSGSNSLTLDNMKLPRPASGTNSLEIQNSQFISSKNPAFRKDAERQYSSVILNLDDEFKFGGGLSLKTRGSDEYSSGENWNYLDVLDFSGSWMIGDNNKVSAGRKLYTWADWDSDWKLGVFQPRYTENGLRPKEAGFTGGFFDVHDEHWALTLAAMPVFVPDFGPHISVQDNQLTSKNPWFLSPPAHFLLTDTNPPTQGDIHYDIADHNAMQIASHGGAAGKLEYANGGYGSRWSYAYKPINQFVVSFPSGHPLAVGASGDFMMISVTPRVVYERVTNWDQSVTSGRWTLNGGVAYDSPVKNPGVDSSTSQQLADAWIVAASVTRRLEEAGPHGASVKLGFLKVNGGDADATGRFAGDGSIFGRRFQFYEAYLLALKEELRSGLRFPLETEARVIYDRMQGGGVFSLSTGMNFTRAFRADLQLDVLGLLTSNAPINDGFLSDFRANDRLGLGVSYVF
jgi:hypothetical protein